MSNKKQPHNPQLGSHQTASKATPIIVAVIILLCLGSIVGISLALSGKDDKDNSAATPGTVTQESTPAPSSEPAPSTPASSSAPPDTGLTCTEPPAVPGQGQQFAEPPAKSLADDATWVATLKTNCGDITIDLDGAKAPQTVSSFIFLAQKGYFDDSPCHRLVTSGLYVLQCGDPTGQGTGGPGYGFGIENAPADGSYPAGTLAMARTSDPNSNGSQFFMVYQDSQLPTDGGGYSIFGKVTKGLDIIAAIASGGDTTGAGDGAPAQPISILNVSVEEK